MDTGPRETREERRGRTALSEFHAALESEISRLRPDRDNASGEKKELEGRADVAAAAAAIPVTGGARVGVGEGMGTGGDKKVDVGDMEERLSAIRESKATSMALKQREAGDLNSRVIKLNANWGAVWGGCD